MKVERVKAPKRIGDVHIPERNAHKFEFASSVVQQPPRKALLFPKIRQVQTFRPLLVLEFLWSFEVLLHMQLRNNISLSRYLALCVGNVVANIANLATVVLQD